MHCDSARPRKGSSKLGLSLLLCSSPPWPASTGSPQFSPWGELQLLWPLPAGVLGAASGNLSPNLSQLADQGAGVWNHVTAPRPSSAQ